MDKTLETEARQMGKPTHVLQLSAEGIIFITHTIKYSNNAKENQTKTTTGFIY